MLLCDTEALSRLCPQDPISTPLDWHEAQDGQFTAAPKRAAIIQVAHLQCHIPGEASR